MAAFETLIRLLEEKKERKRNDRGPLGGLLNTADATAQGFGNQLRQQQTAERGIQNTLELDKRRAEADTERFRKATGTAGSFSSMQAFSNRSEMGIEEIDQRLKKIGSASNTVEGKFTIGLLNKQRSELVRVRDEQRKGKNKLEQVIQTEARKKNEVLKDDLSSFGLEDTVDNSLPVDQQISARRELIRQNASAGGGLGMKATGASKIEQKVSGEVQSQEAKAGAKAKRDSLGAFLKTETLVDTWLKRAKKQTELTGVKPGPLQGLTSLVTDPLRENEFSEAFTGTSNDWAASQLKIHMPGSRAGFLLDKFKKSRPGRFSTISSAIENLTDTYEGIINSDMQGNPEEYLPEGLEWRGTQTQFKLLRSRVEAFSEEYRRGMYAKMFQDAPELLRPEEMKIVKQLGADQSEDQDALQRLGFDLDRFEILEVS